MGSIHNGVKNGTERFCNRTTPVIELLQGPTLTLCLPADALLRHGLLHEDLQTSDESFEFYGAQDCRRLLGALGHLTDGRGKRGRERDASVGECMGARLSACRGQVSWGIKTETRSDC
jgi:hypothetical protein